MNLTNSPSFQDPRKERHLLKQRGSQSKKRTFRLLLAALLFLSVTLFSFRYLPLNSITILSGRGDITGQVVNENGLPFQAQIYVFGIDHALDTNSDGTFTYTNVPAGTHNLIVVYNGTAQEFPVDVQAGENLDIGILQIQVSTPTARP